MTMSVNTGRHSRCIWLVAALAVAATTSPVRAESVEAGSQDFLLALPRTATHTLRGPVRQVSPAQVPTRSSEIETGSSTAAPAPTQPSHVAAATSSPAAAVPRPGPADDTRFGTGGAVEVGPGPFGSHGANLDDEPTPESQTTTPRESVANPGQRSLYTGFAGTAAGPQYSTQLPVEGLGRR